MPATTRTPDSLTSIAAGHAITWFTPTATGGDNFANTTGTVVVLLQNDSDAAVTVTIDCPVACSRGYYHDVEVEVALGTSWASTILPVAMFADPTTGKTLITCSAVTDVKMALINVVSTPAA